MADARSLATGCRGVAAVAGLVVSAGLISAAVWFHNNMEPLIRIFFVLPLGTVGVLLGLASIGYFITGRLR